MTKEESLFEIPDDGRAFHWIHIQMMFWLDQNGKLGCFGCGDMSNQKNNMEIIFSMGMGMGMVTMEWWEWLLQYNHYI